MGVVQHRSIRSHLVCHQPSNNAHNKLQPPQMDIRGCSCRRTVSMVEFQAWTSWSSRLRRSHHLQLAQSSLECQHSLARYLRGVFLDLPDPRTLGKTSDWSSGIGLGACQRRNGVPEESVLLRNARRPLVVRRLEDVASCTPRGHLAGSYSQNGVLTTMDFPKWHQLGRAYVKEL